MTRVTAMSLMRSMTVKEPAFLDPRKAGAREEQGHSKIDTEMGIYRGVATEDIFAVNRPLLFAGEGEKTALQSLDEGLTKD